MTLTKNELNILTNMNDAMKLLNQLMEDFEERITKLEIASDWEGIKSEFR